MKIKEVIVETPQLIPSLNKIDVDLIKQECINSLKSNSSKKIKSLSNKTSLYHLEKSPSNGCYFLASDNKIDYLVNYKTVEISKEVLPSSIGLRQVLIKRFPNASSFSSGIGAFIFWEILFKETECLISDSQQTDNGKQFWEYRISEAFDKNLTVRLINTNDNTFKDVKSILELDDLSPEIWGKSKWFQRIILVIFKDK